MKSSIKSILVISLLFFSFTGLNAQKKIAVTEVNKKINDVNGNALKVNIYRTDEKTISKAWKKKMKRYNASVKTRKNEIRATEVEISSISQYPIQVFAAVERKKKENYDEFFVIFLNGNIPISKSVDVSGYTAASKILKDFANEISKEAASAYLDQEKDALDDMEDNLKDLDKATKNAKKDIKDKKEEIQELESLISENEKKTEELNKKIKDQKSSVKNAKKEVDLYD